MSEFSLTQEQAGQLSAALWRQQALRFGEFTTKSSRPSPYFIDTSRMYQGEAWDLLMDYYLQALTYLDFETQHLAGFFGAAYKGIPLAVSLSERWYRRTGHSVPFAFSRKEVKQHGEGGSMVGSFPDLRLFADADTPGVSPAGVVACDDVLTSGRSLREALRYLKDQAVPCLCAIVAIDRGERDDLRPDLTAKKALEDEFGLSIISVISLSQMIHHLRDKLSGEMIARISHYRLTNEPNNKPNNDKA